jgi:alpha-L-fucosidase
MLKRRIGLLLLAGLCCLNSFSQTTTANDKRMEWWREARFGMFIHWGVYAVPAGTYKGQKINRIGEWIMNRGKIPVADYQQFAHEFNPVKYDAGCMGAYG